MIFTIENEYLCLDICDLGAEMHKIFNKKNSIEYLWDANPKYWGGHAYNLFPFCGRLWDSKYTYKGNEYNMDLHGFARKAVFSVKEKRSETISFELVSNEEIFEIYPFSFKLTITYSLDKNKIYNYFTVENTDAGKMYFSMGTHPGFFVPLGEGESFEDYYIEFPEEQTSIEKLKISESGYLLKGTEQVKLKNNKILPLSHNLFAQSNFFLNMSKSVALRSEKSNKAVILTYPDMNYLGFWKVDDVSAAYLCIEPWQGCPAEEGKVDRLETKRDIITLDSLEKWDTFISIEIE